MCIARGWSCSEHRSIPWSAGLPWCPGADTIPATLLCWMLFDCSGKGDALRVRLDKVLLCWISLFLIILLGTYFPDDFTFFFTLSIINVLKPVLGKTNEKGAMKLLLSQVGKYIKKKKPETPVKILPLKYILIETLSFVLKIVWGLPHLVEQSPMPAAQCHPCASTQRSPTGQMTATSKAAWSKSDPSCRRSESQPQLHWLL